MPELVRASKLAPALALEPVLATARGKRRPENVRLGSVSRTVYRAPVVIGVRGVGIGAVGLGLCLIGAMITVATSPGGVLGVVLWIAVAGAAVVAATVFATGVLRVAGLRSRLVIDDEGLVNATGKGVGVRRMPWRDVRKVQADGQVVSVDLAGGRQSVIHTAMLDVQPRELSRELRSRLNRDRGYTPFGSAEPQASLAENEAD